MKFIHIADVHLGMQPDAGYSWSQKRGEEFWETFRKVISICEEEQTDLLLIAGDLFHRQPLKKELKEVDYLFSTLTHTKVVLIAGNHDCIRPESYYRDFPWTDQVTMLDQDSMDRVYFEELDTEITGFSYCKTEIRESRYSEAVPGERGGIQILLAHGGDEKHVPIDFADLEKKGFDYVALGHIHKPQLMYESRMAYSGSLEPTDRNDMGSHGYIAGEITDDGLQFHFVPCASREYMSLWIKITPDIAGGALFEKVKDAITENGQQHIYKIVLEGNYDPESPIDPEILYRAGNVIQVTDESSPEYDIRELLKEHKDDVIGMYIEAFQGQPLTEERKKALFCGINALLMQGGRQQW